MSKVLAKAEHLGLLQQVKTSNHWDAIAADNAAFKTVQWIDTGQLIPDFGATVDQFNVTSQGVGMFKESERFFIDSTSGLVKLPFSGTCDKTTLAAFLAAAFQGCIEDTSTPYKKTFLPYLTAASPSMITNAGYLFTLAVKQGASADDGFKIHNALIDTLNLIWEVESSGIARLVKMTGTWVGNDYSQEVTFNGTWTNLTPSQAGFFNNTDTWGVTYGTPLFSIGGLDYSDQCIRRFELQINNNIGKACVSTGGKATGYIWSPQYKILLQLDHNSVTEKIHRDFIDGEDVTLIWSNDSAGADTDGKFTIAVTNSLGAGGVGKLSAPVKGYDGDYLTLNLDIDVQRLGGSVTPIIAIIVDTIDWGF